MWRNLQVCDGCWVEHEGGRGPVRIVDQDMGTCFDCEEITSSGIFVRVEINWP